MINRHGTFGKYLRSLFVAVLASAAMVITLLVAPPPPAQGAFPGDHGNIVSTEPSSNTPHVLDGYVRGFAHVGPNTIAVGNFTQVRNPGSDTPVISRTNIFSFNTETGQVNSDFTPQVNGEVTDIIPAGDGVNVFIGGGFNEVNGATTRAVAKLNGQTGQKTAGFTTPAFNGRVTQVLLKNDTLYVSGRFTKVGSADRTLLAGLNPDTGAVLENVDVLFEEPRKGTLNLYSMDITPDGSRLIGIGNFLKVNGERHPQIVMLALDSTGATTAPWATERYAPACSSSFDSYMRDVEFSPDGSYFVVVTTGAYFRGTLCDTAARFETGAVGTAQEPTWIDYTGGDTLISVSVTERVVYVGGHQRWMNNPFAGDRVGPGAVSREGLAALDVRNGMPFSWNPGRTRGYGVYQFLADDQGLWIGSDTDRISGWQYRGRIAYMPLANGVQFPHDNVGNADNPLFLIDSAEATGETELVMRELSSAGLATSQSVSTNVDWSGVRAAFMVDGWVYTANSDGTLQRRTFDGTSFGAAENIDLNLLTAFASEMTSMTSAFFDPETARMYFTRGGSSTLNYRYFNTESTITGAELYAAPSSGAAINWSRVKSAFLSGDTLHVADNTGELSTWEWDSTLGNVVPDSQRAVSGPRVDGVDWSSQDLFVLAGNHPAEELEVLDPNVEFEATISGATVNFDSAGSSTQDGTITNYEWDYGDGNTAVGPVAQHTYGEPGSYTVALKITTSSGEVGEASRIIVVGGSNTGPDIPDDPYGEAVYNDVPEIYWRLNDATGGTAVDASGGESHGTYRRFVTRGTEGALVGEDDKAISFTSNSSFSYGWISSNNSYTNPGPFSVEAWFKTSSTQGGTIASFGNRADQLSNQHDRKIFLTNSGQLVFGTYPGSEARATTSNAYNDDAWHHVVATQGSEGMRLYVDGALAASHPATTAENFTGYWKVGAETTWSGNSRAWLIGSVDEFAVYGRALSAEQAAEHYTLGSNEPPANQLPVAEFDASAHSLTISVDGSASSDPDGTLASYEWDFGDGNTAQGIFVNHSYAEDGDYEVTLTVTDNRGATASKTETVSVQQLPNELPNADFTASSLGLDVTLDAAAASDPDGTIQEYSWDLGDGNTATGQVVEHEYAEAGSYQVTLTVTDDRAGQHSVTKEIPVTQIAPASFVDSAARYMNSSNAQLQLPAGIEPGDGIIMLTTSNSTSVSMEEPSGVTGWSKLGQEAVGGVHTRAYAKVATAEDAGATVTLPTGSMLKTTIHALVYRGISADWIADSAAVVTTSSSVEKVTPAVAVEQPGSTVISYWADKGSIENSITPAAETEPRGTAVGSGNGRIVSVAADQQTLTTGLTGGVVGTMDVASVRTAMWSIVINPGSSSVPEPNQPPVADFAVEVDGLDIAVDGNASTDPDGEIAEHAWDFGDGNTATGAAASHSYAEGGDYTLTLRVTDGEGLQSEPVTQTVSITAPEPDPDPDPDPGQVVDFVAGVEANLSSSLPRLNVPESVQEGDGLLLMATVNSSTAALDEPAGVTGWTLQDSLQEDGTHTVLYSKVAAASDAGTQVSIPLSTTAKTGIHLLAYRGIGEAWVQDSAIELLRTNGVEKIAPQVEASGGGLTVLGYWADKGSQDNALTAQPELLDRGSTVGSGGGRITSLVAQSDGAVPAGTVGGFAATLDSAGARTVAMTVTLAGKDE
ncbi:hypothetical protein CQ019_16845 [Arthrobacter sp. MYb229]|nr:hypothetical protein CQ019_16845 [Arthrobacter sp. MYb229]PRB47601.1 hypothetical protein CQ013_16870 [Arthrobacter sp. MYb216]